MATRNQPRFRQQRAYRELSDRAGVATRRVNDENLAFPRRPHVDVDRAAARYRDHFQTRQAIHHIARERRNLRHHDRGVGRHRNDLDGIALIFIQPRRAGLRVPPLHRLVRPRQFIRTDFEIALARRTDRFLEHGRQHETIAYDCNGARHADVSCLMLPSIPHAGGIA